MQTSNLTYQAVNAHHSELHRSASMRRQPVKARSESSLMVRLVALVKTHRQPTQAAAQAKRSGIVVGRFAV